MFAVSPNDMDPIQEPFKSDDRIPALCRTTCDPEYGPTIIHSPQPGSGARLPKNAHQCIVGSLRVCVLFLGGAEDRPIASWIRPNGQTTDDKTSTLPQINMEAQKGHFVVVL